MLSNLSLLLLLLSGVCVSSKPIDDVSLAENVNEVDVGTQGDYKKGILEEDEVDVTKVVEVPKPFSSLSKAPNTSSAKRISTVTSAAASQNITGDDMAREIFASRENTTGDNAGSTRQQGFAWFLTPFTQKVQFSPQTFFQDRIGQIKDTLNNIGSIFPNQQDTASKQFVNGGLANLVGLNDSGFYTNRLDPVGFFGGNGWLANKGGILGGPGAFISTGSLLTDYPTPYKK